MKFLHIGDNICGIPNSIVRAQRKAGYNARVLSFELDKQGHESDELVSTEYKIDKILTLLFRKEDVYLFVGDTILGGADILLWKLLGKKVGIHYHGSEVRGKGKRFFHRFADALFVSTPDLLDDVPEATWLPAPIFMEDYKEHYTIGTVIAHAPSDRETKGTGYLLDSFDNIKKRVPGVTLDLIEGIPFQEALERYRKSTIMVDQLKIGWYGMVTLECMAMGVPVMCYIRGDLKKFFNGISPLCFTSPTWIEKDMEVLLNNRSYLDEYSLVGKEYVNRVHNPKRVVALINKGLGIE